MAVLGRRMGAILPAKCRRKRESFALMTDKQRGFVGKAMEQRDPDLDRERISTGLHTANREQVHLFYRFMTIAGIN